MYKPDFLLYYKTLQTLYKKLKICYPIIGGCMEVKDLKFDKRNYRRHNEKNQSLIKKSINEVGFGRSVVIDADNEIICGNGVVSQVAKSTPVKVIETNGSELIVVKRTDLKTNDERRKQLAVMDNSTSDSSDFDFTLLQEDFDTEELEDWGLDVDFDVEPTEPKDISDDLKEGYEVVCECETEQEQEQLFYKLTEEGIKCRLLTL